MEEESAAWSLISAGKHPTKSDTMVATVLLGDSIFTIELVFGDDGMTGTPNQVLGDIMEQVFDTDSASEGDQIIAYGADDFMASVAQGQVDLTARDVFDEDKLVVVSLEKDGTASSLNMGADGVLRGIKYDLGDSDRKSVMLEVRELEPVINALLEIVAEKMSFNEFTKWLGEQGTTYLLCNDYYE